MTSTGVSEWLRPLGAAVSAHQLYRPDHPRVVEAVTSLEEASRRLVGDRKSVSLCVIEERLTCDGQVVSGAGPLAAKLFEALSVCGFDRITLGRGVTTGELLGLVASLAGANRESGHAPPTLQSTAHLVFSALTRDTDQTETVEAPPAETADSLNELWRGVEEHRSLDQDLVDAVLAPFVSIVTGQRDGALPLSELASHDSYTATHIGNVALLTIALAEASGLPAPALRAVGIAALLHDIGKMKIPSAILSSTGRLSGAELARMREHPEVGARMLMATPDVPELAPIVAFEHHLHAGGGGYPEVPSGWRSHPASRMTHIADVYDALRTNRPYRAALEHDEIVEMMSRDRSTVFDAGLLDLFFERVVPRTGE